MSYEIIGKVAGFFALLGYLPYIVTTLQGKNKPNRATWWVWGTLGIVQIISYYYSDQKTDSAMWVLAAYTICQIVTALLSLKFGEGGWGKLDRMCLIGVGISLLLWLLFNSPLISLLFTLVIDGLGAIPTVAKSYQEPHNESSFSWTVFLIANSLNLFAIEEWSPRSAYPLYLFCLSATLSFLLIIRPQFIAYKQKNIS